MLIQLGELMTNRSCFFCKGDHTDVKCPHLDGYVNHMLSVINSNNCNLQDVHSTPRGVASLFIERATPSDLLNFDKWFWFHAAITYSKKMNYKAAGLKRRGKKRKKALKCGYCGRRGHTRKSCAVFKKHINTIDSISDAFRDEFLIACKKNGIGVGSIINLSLNERGKHRQTYIGNLPETMMAMIIDLPIHDLSPFVNQQSRDNLFVPAEFKLKLIAPTKYYSEESIVDLPITNEIFDGAFKSFSSISHRSGLTTNYDFTLVGKSKNLNYNQKSNRPYINLFKKHDKYTMSRHVDEATSWLRERSLL